MGAGCGSCATLDEAFMGNANNAWGGNQSASLANSVMPGSVVMTQQQNDFLAPPAINNNPAVMSGVYQAGAAQAAMQQMVKSANPQMVASAIQSPVYAASTGGTSPNKKVESFVNSNGQVVTVSTTTPVNTPQSPSTQPNNIARNSITSTSSRSNDIRIIMYNLGFLILAALAVNESAKYYINKSLQTSESNIPYYLVYAVLAVLVLVGVSFLTKHYLN